MAAPDGGLVFAPTPDNPYLGMFGITPEPADPASLDTYRFAGRGSFTAQLKRADVELSAVNPAVSGSTARPGEWAMAFLTPAYPSPGYWHIATVRVGGILEHTFLPVAGSRVGIYLKRFGVPAAEFEARPGSPVAHNPWGEDGEKAPAKLRTVYFIQPVAGGLIKIGIASNVTARLSGLQTGSPVELRVIGVIRGVDQTAEAGLHLRFAASRKHGEWFEPTPELLAYIAEHAEVPR